MDKKRIGVLSNNCQSPWLKQTTEVLGSLGELAIYKESLFTDEFVESFDLVLVDASGLQMELAERVAWLNGRFPQTPIVVLTSSPTWRRAKAVLQAGASDYMRRSIESDQLLQRCRLLLSWPP